MTYTLGTILTQVRSLLNEPVANFWSDAILTNYINEAVRVIAEKAGCYRTIKIVSTTPLARMVAFTGYKCIAVEYANVALIKITPLQVGHAKLDGVTPQFWYEFNNAIGIEPVPADTYALTLYVADIPATLSTVSDSPAIPYSLQNIIHYFAVARALEQDRKQGEAMQYMSLFQNELDYMSKNILPNIPDGVEDLRFR